MEKQVRSITIRDINIQEDKRTINVAFASSEPYARNWYHDNKVVDEVLDVTNKSMRTEFLRSGANFLVGHNYDDVVGVVEDIQIDESAKVARADIRFGKSARAEEIYRDIKEGIRKNISVGYFIYGYEVLQDKEDKPVHLVNDWEPVEISVVPLPADRTVGVGRSKEITSPIKSIKEKKEIKNMSEQDKKYTSEHNKKTDQMAQETKQHKEVNEIVSCASDATEIARFAEDKPELGDLAINAISSGMCMSEFKDIALKHMYELLNRKKNYQNKEDHKGLSVMDTAPSAFIGMTKKETNRFSFCKWFAHLLEPSSKNLRNRAAFEIEAAKAATEKRSAEGKLCGQYTIPEDVLMEQRNYYTPRNPMFSMRDVSATTTSAWIDTNILYNSFIGLLMDALLFPGMGATVLDNLTGNVHIPKQTQGVTAYAIAPDAEPTASQIATTSIPLVPHGIGATIKLMRSALIQDSIGLENLVRQQMIMQMALYIQKMIIQGKGANNEPQGILTNTAIDALPGATNGKALDWESIVRLHTLVASKNATGNNMAYITNAVVRGALVTTEKSQRTAHYIWNDMSPSAPLYGFPAYITNAMPSTLTKGNNAKCSAIIFGNWSDLIIGFWTGIDINVNPYTHARQGAVEITTLQNYDLAIRYTESFAYAKDVVTT